MSLVFCSFSVHPNDSPIWHQTNADKQIIQRRPMLLALLFLMIEIVLSNLAMPVLLNWHQLTMLRSVRATPAASNSRAASRTVNVWFSLHSEGFGTRLARVI
jgi:hypothetical protein